MVLTKINYCVRMSIARFERMHYAPGWISADEKDTLIHYNTNTHTFYTVPEYSYSILNVDTLSKNNV